MTKIYLPSLLYSVLIVFVSCEDTSKITHRDEYKGPVLEAENIETLYSENAQVKVRVNAPLQQQFDNEDIVYPEGIVIHFYNEKGDNMSKLTADSGRYQKDEDLYMAKGNVVVEEWADEKKLSSEELFWDPKKEIIYTEKSVKIQTKDEIITGEGFQANQNFTEYEIIKPTGIFDVNEEK